MIHGLVDRPLSLSMAEIKRLASVTRILALECGGNSAGEWATTTGADVQRSYGLVSGMNLNGIIAEDQVMDATSLSKVRMPNRDGFVADPRPDVRKPRPQR